jgi:hypothetical protein
MQANRSSPSQSFTLAVCQGRGSTYYLEQEVWHRTCACLCILGHKRFKKSTMCPGLRHKRNRIILCCNTTTNKINALTSITDPHWGRLRSPLGEIVEYVTDCCADASNVKRRPRSSAFFHISPLSTDPALSIIDGTDHGLGVYVIGACEWPRSSIVLPTSVAQSRNVSAPS